MRRTLSTIVLAGLLAPLLLPAFASAQACVHACCRRSAHHCHSQNLSNNRETAVRGVSQCCGCRQTSPPPLWEPEISALAATHQQVATVANDNSGQAFSRRVFASCGRAPPAASLA